MQWAVFILLILPALPSAVEGADAAGCADLKLFPRLEGCVIVECSARHHDSFDAGNAGTLDADSNTLSYSCPLRDLQKMTRDFDAQLRKAGYQNVTLDRGDAGPSVSAHKGSQWIRWSAGAEDTTTSYSLTTASTAPEKLEACTGPPLIAALRQCEIAECESKSEDFFGIRTAQNKETPLTGNVQTVTLTCPAQPFDAVQRELKTSGFEILFSDGENAITARSGKRWMELAAPPNGDSVSYVWTVIPSAEELTAQNAEPPLIAVAAPVPALPARETAAPPVAEHVVPAANVPAPVPTPPSPTLPAPAAPYQAVFVYPKPIFQVPISPTPERIAGVRGLVTIHVLVDVDEKGAVTKAVLTGRITDNVRKLENAALDAVSQWRFEPARQDGRIVACVKIPVEIRFQGRPANFLSRSLAKLATQ